MKKKNVQPKARFVDWCQRIRVTPKKLIEDEKITSRDQLISFCFRMGMEIDEETILSLFPQKRSVENVAPSFAVISEELVEIDDGEPQTETVVDWATELQPRRQRKLKIRRSNDSTT